MKPRPNAGVEELRLEKEIAAKKEACMHMPLTFDDLAHVIEGWTKIPVKRLTQAESAKLISLEERLHQRIVGQDARRFRALTGYSPQSFRVP